MTRDRGSKHVHKKTLPPAVASSKAPSPPARLRQRRKAVVGKWLAWNREQTRIIACGRTRTEARTAPAKTGEPAPVLENVERMRKDFADLFAGGEERRQGLLEEGGEPLTEADVSAYLGFTPEEVEKRRVAGFFLAVPVEEGAFLFPSWQFIDRGTLPGLPEVLGDLRTHNRHPLAQLRFFLSRNLRLDGATPLTELRRGRVEKVRAAARTYGEHGAA
jgi:hypothetical protein